jgi:hypothetical protein
MEVSDQLYPNGRSPWHSLDRRLNGLQVDLNAVEKRTILCRCRESNYLDVVISLELSVLVSFRNGFKEM